MLIKKQNQHYVPKGWGYEQWIYNKNYCGKILFFHKGKKCSMHFHPIKDEVLYLSFGKIELHYCPVVGMTTQIVTLEPGDAFHVEPGLPHQMIALEDSYIFEVSTHHEDDDSVRIVRGD